jgi:hypothetical protein
MEGNINELVRFMSVVIEDDNLAWNTERRRPSPSPSATSSAIFALLEDIHQANRSRDVRDVSVAQATKLADRVMRNPDWRFRAARRWMHLMRKMLRHNRDGIGVQEREHPWVLLGDGEIQRIIGEANHYHELSVEQIRTLHGIIMRNPRLREEMLRMLWRQSPFRDEETADHRSRIQEGRGRRHQRTTRRRRMYSDEYDTESEECAPSFIYHLRQNTFVAPSDSNSIIAGADPLSLLERQLTPIGPVCYPPSPSPRIPVPQQHFKSQHPDIQGQEDPDQSSAPPHAMEEMLHNLWANNKNTNSDEAPVAMSEAILQASNGQTSSGSNHQSTTPSASTINQINDGRVIITSPPPSSPLASTGNALARTADAERDHGTGRRDYFRETAESSRRRRRHGIVTPHIPRAVDVDRQPTVSDEATESANMATGPEANGDANPMNGRSLSSANNVNEDKTTATSAGDVDTDIKSINQEATFASSQGSGSGQGSGSSSWVDVTAESANTMKPDGSADSDHGEEEESESIPNGKN